jgi:hypothetical protein
VQHAAGCCIQCKLRCATRNVWCCYCNGRWWRYIVGGAALVGGLPDSSRSAGGLFPGLKGCLMTMVDSGTSAGTLTWSWSSSPSFHASRCFPGAPCNPQVRTSGDRSGLLIFSGSLFYGPGNHFFFGWVAHLDCQGASVVDGGPDDFQAVLGHDAEGVTHPAL